MATREIVVYDDPLLREKSLQVRQVSGEIQDLIDDMIETMHEANGIGLAAIQVGVKQRVIIVHLPEPEPEEGEEAEVEPIPGAGELFVIINPEIARRSTETEEGIEGCLSIPGLVGEVDRSTSVTVKGIDRDGKPVRVKASGLLARVFQHEIDHCNGTLFIDRIDDPEKLWAVEVGEEEAAEADQKLSV